MVHANLYTPQEQLEKQSICPDQGSYNPHLATGTYISPYYSSAAVLTNVPDGLPSSNPAVKAVSLQDEILIDQITSDIYAYDYTNKLLMSSGVIDHDTTEDLQRFLRD